jgi:hypothetical protein
MPCSADSSGENPAIQMMFDFAPMSQALACHGRPTGAKRAGEIAENRTRTATANKRRYLSFANLITDTEAHAVR